MSLTLRSVKGTRLTIEEMDENLSFLEGISYSSSISPLLLDVSSSLMNETSRSISADNQLSSSLATVTSIALEVSSSYERQSNKSLDVENDQTSDDKYPSVRSIKSYVDTLVASVINDQGNWDASSNTFPTSGSGYSGEVLKGNIWFVSVPGVLKGQNVIIGDSFRAAADNPGQTPTNWNILDTNIGYIPENVTFRRNNLIPDGTGRYYSTTDAVIGGLATKQNVIRRLTTTQRNAISTPTVEFMIYNTTNNLLETYNGVKWVSQNGYFAVSSSVEGTVYVDTYATVPSMSLSPGQGVYKVDFNSEYSYVEGNIVQIAGGHLDTLYTDLNTRTVTSTSHSLAFGNGEVLLPGVYAVNGAVSVTGTLTFNGLNNSDSLFIIKSAGACNTAASVTMYLINGAQASNIFWVAEGAVGIGASNTAYGTFLAHDYTVALGTPTTFVGRLLSTAGAVTFGGGSVSKPTTDSVIELDLIEDFFAYTKLGAVSNTAVATITGNLGSISGAVTIYAGTTLNGNIYSSSQPFGENAKFSVFVNGVKLPISERVRNSTNYTSEIALTAIATVADGQSIDIRFKTDVGSLSLQKKILILQKLE